MADFIKGAALSALFYHEAIRPILDLRFHGLPHSAALIGPGSDVLGFDTALSTDHDWGPRCLLFLHDDDHARHAAAIDAALAAELPRTFYGFSTDFGDPLDNGVRALTAASEGPLRHAVVVQTLRGHIAARLGVDIDSALDGVDWLSLSQQELLCLTAGPVHHDDLGLSLLRAHFGFYPHDVWLYQMAALWTRIGDDEHLMSRAGDVGDELGSAVIGARLVRDAMQLAFLLERRYAPYPKWFGSAFAKLSCADALLPELTCVVAARDWRVRAAALMRAFEHLVRMHNALALTQPIAEQASPFYDRPYPVIWGGAIAEALRARVTDLALLDLIASAHGRLVGGVDALTDVAPLAADARLRPAWQALYRHRELS